MVAKVLSMHLALGQSARTQKTSIWDDTSVLHSDWEKEWDESFRVETLRPPFHLHADIGPKFTAQP